MKNQINNTHTNKRQFSKIHTLTTLLTFFNINEIN